MDSQFKEILYYWKGTWTEKLTFVFIVCVLGFAMFLIVETAFSDIWYLVVPMFGGLILVMIYGTYGVKTKGPRTRHVMIGERDDEEWESERIIGSLTGRWWAGPLMLMGMSVFPIGIASEPTDHLPNGVFLCLFIFLTMVWIFSMKTKIIDLFPDGLTVTFSLFSIRYVRTMIESEDVDGILITRRVRLADENYPNGPGKLANIQMKIDIETQISTFLFDHTHFTEEQLEQIVEHLTTITGLEGKIEERVFVLNY
jgi:hypothetical protein